MLSVLQSRPTPLPHDSPMDRSNALPLPRQPQQGQDNDMSHRGPPGQEFHGNPAWHAPPPQQSIRQLHLNGPAESQDRPHQERDIFKLNPIQLPLPSPHGDQNARYLPPLDVPFLTGSPARPPVPRSPLASGRNVSFTNPQPQHSNAPLPRVHYEKSSPSQQHGFYPPHPVQAIPASMPSPEQQSAAAQMQTASQQEELKRIRACESCRSLKVRCEPDLSSAQGPCKRCARAGRQCIVTHPNRRRSKKELGGSVSDGNNSKVAELERKIDGLMETLHRVGHFQSEDSSVAGPVLSREMEPRSAGSSSHGSQFGPPTYLGDSSKDGQHKRMRTNSLGDWRVGQSSISPTSVAMEPLPSNPARPAEQYVKTSPQHAQASVAYAGSSRSTSFDQFKFEELAPLVDIFLRDFAGQLPFVLLLAQSSPPRIWRTAPPVFLAMAAAVCRTQRLQNWQYLSDEVNKTLSESVQFLQANSPARSPIEILDAAMALLITAWPCYRDGAAAHDAEWLISIGFMLLRRYQKLPPSAKGGNGQEIDFARVTLGLYIAAFQLRDFSGFFTLWDTCCSSALNILSQSREPGDLDTVHWSRLARLTGRVQHLVDPGREESETTYLLHLREPRALEREINQTLASWRDQDQTPRDPSFYRELCSTTHLWEICQLKDDIDRKQVSIGSLKHLSNSAEKLCASYIDEQRLMPMPASNAQGMQVALALLTMLSIRQYLLSLKRGPEQAEMHPSDKAMLGFFDEFMVVAQASQKRRLIPSGLANMVDLLGKVDDELTRAKASEKRGSMEREGSSTEQGSAYRRENENGRERELTSERCQEITSALGQIYGRDAAVPGRILCHLLSLRAE